MSELSIRLRPLIEDDLAMFRRFATEPGLIGLDWAGFRDAQAPARRFAIDGYLGPDDGRLMVEVERVSCGFSGRFLIHRDRFQMFDLLPQYRRG